MKLKEKRPLSYYIRPLHRDIGFLAVGFTIIFCISGVILIFKETDFLKKEKIIEKTILPNLEVLELGKALHLREFKILKEDGGIVYFENGSYNKTTGNVSYESKELPSFFEKLNNVHKSSSKNIIHWFTMLYGISLLFLAISSFWMYKPKTKMSRRGIVLSLIGFVFAAMVIIL